MKREVGLDVALRELDRYQAMTDREKLEFNMEEGKTQIPPPSPPPSPDSI